jgi:hypothetical protein
LHLQREAAAKPSIANDRVQIGQRQSPPQAPIPIVPHETVPRLCPVDVRQRQKSPVLNTNLVGGTGHYLNSPAESKVGVLELLKANRVDRESQDGAEGRTLPVHRTRPSRSLRPEGGLSRSPLKRENRTMDSRSPASAALSASRELWRAAPCPRKSPRPHENALPPRFSTLFPGSSSLS